MGVGFYWVMARLGDGGVCDDVAAVDVTRCLGWRVLWRCLCVVCGFVFGCVWAVSVAVAV